MSLTAQQLVDVRRYCGYGASGTTATQAFREPVYTNVSYAALSLDTRLASLMPEEESTLVTYFLMHLPLREQEIQAASQNLDTESTAVWRHNQNEVAERRSLFRQLRVDLCGFLAIPPGPTLSAGGRLIRG